MPPPTMAFCTAAGSSWNLRPARPAGIGPKGRTHISCVNERAEDRYGKCSQPCTCARTEHRGDVAGERHAVVPCEVKWEVK